MSAEKMDGFFIAPDANNEDWIWRERGDYPVPVASRRQFRDDPELWDVLAAVIEEKP